MDEFDVWDGGVGVVSDLLLELFDIGDCWEVDIERERLLFGGGFEEEFYHLKKYQILDEIFDKLCAVFTILE